MDYAARRPRSTRGACSSVSPCVDVVAFSPASLSRDLGHWCGLASVRVFAPSPNREIEPLPLEDDNTVRKRPSARLPRARVQCAVGATYCRRRPRSSIASTSAAHPTDVTMAAAPDGNVQQLQQQQQGGLGGGSASAQQDRASPSSSSSAPPLRLTIKNPARAFADFECAVPEGWTVRDVKAMLARDYEGKPKADEQKLIFAGKVLEDAKPLSDYIDAARASACACDDASASDDADEPREEASFKIHLVVRSFMCAKPAADAPATPSPSTPAAPALAPSTAPTSTPARSPASEMPSPQYPAATPRVGEATPPPSTNPMLANPVLASAYEAALRAILTEAARDPANAAGTQPASPWWHGTAMQHGGGPWTTPPPSTPASSAGASPYVFTPPVPMQLPVPVISPIAFYPAVPPGAPHPMHHSMGGFSAHGQTPPHAHAHPHAHGAWPNAAPLDASAQSAHAHVHGGTGLRARHPPRAPASGDERGEEADGGARGQGADAGGVALRGLREPAPAPAWWRHYINVKLLIKLLFLGLALNGESSPQRILLTGAIFFVVYLQQMGVFNSNGPLVHKFCVWYDAVFGDNDATPNEGEGSPGDGGGEGNGGEGASADAAHTQQQEENASPTVRTPSTSGEEAVSGGPAIAAGASGRQGSDGVGYAVHRATREVQGFLVALLASLVPSFTAETFAQQTQARRAAAMRRAARERPHQD